MSWLIDVEEQLGYNPPYIYTKITKIKYFRSRAIGLKASRDRIFPTKTGEYPRIFPNYQNCACCEKDLKDNNQNSLHLARKYASIFVLGH